MARYGDMKIRLALIVMHLPFVDRSRAILCQSLGVKTQKAGRAAGFGDRRIRAARFQA